MKLFLNAVEGHDGLWPSSRIQVQQSRKNVKVCDVMTEICGSDRGSFTLQGGLQGPTIVLLDRRFLIFLFQQY